ncbi:MAG: FGGY-family carbohydrate kinase [Vicinamibacterales bacterium]
MPLYLGLDSSTQSLSAIVIEVDADTRRVVFEDSLAFDQEFPQYGTHHGVLPSTDLSVAVSSPVLWAAALDTMMARVAAAVDVSRIAAISGSAQQHGSVYLNASATVALGALDPRRPLADQVTPMLSRPVAPIWMDSSTSAECRAIAAAVGGDARLARHTGSRAFERFTGPQIRKFATHEPEAYALTDRIHLVSSFLASLLSGRHAPLDPGDGSGMNLMDLASTTWWEAATTATAPALGRRLPEIAPASSIVGPLARYWQEKHGFPAAQVVVWSGDNPCSLIGTGLVREGRLAVSLGTSDTVFGLMREPRVDTTGTGHVFGAPTGAYMGLTCFKNGSLAREHIRDGFQLSWPEFSRILAATPAGNQGRVFLPWYEAEITPDVPTAGVHRYGLEPGDRDGHVRGVIEAQLLSMATHSQWMGVSVDTIHATGGAAANREILQVMADVFDADVYQFEVGNSASLGAALRAAEADAETHRADVSWDEIVHGLADPIAASRITPRPAATAIYRTMRALYAACEAHALGRGPAPVTGAAVVG